jgi:cold shock CspA family protein
MQPLRPTQREEGLTINIPLQVTFRNMPPSEAIEAAVREKADKLDSFYDRIMGCRVLVEAPHRHHRKGKLYHVRIDLTLPGGEIVVKHEPKRVKPTTPPAGDGEDVTLLETHEPGKYAAHRDVYVAVRDAFDVARRKLQDYARRQRGVVKLHDAPTHGRVTKMFPDEGFGFLESSDGREIYFHQNSVLDPGFSHLKVGSAVYFSEEEGDKGHQASTVKAAGKHGLL